MTTYQVKVSEKFPDGEAVIYTLDEAREFHIDFVTHDNWRSARYGQYVETNDGFVTPIIKRNEATSTPHIKTPTGCFHLKRSGTSFDTKEFFNRNSFSRVSRWNGNSSKLTQNQIRFFQTFGATFDLSFSVKAAYPYIHKLSDIFSMSKQIVVSKLFGEYMSKFREIFISKGIDEEYLVERLKDMMDHATPQTYPVLARMGAAGLGSEQMFDQENLNGKQLPTKAGAFHQLEEAELVEDQKELGAVNSDS